MANVLPFMAAASELKPLQAGTFVLGTHTASIHYTVSGDTFEVVTTVAPDPETAGAEVRRDPGAPANPHIASCRSRCPP